MTHAYLETSISNCIIVRPLWKVTYYANVNIIRSRQWFTNKYGSAPPTYARWRSAAEFPAPIRIPILRVNLRPWRHQQIARAIFTHADVQISSREIKSDNWVSYLSHFNLHFLYKFLFLFFNSITAIPQFQKKTIWYNFFNYCTLNRLTFNYFFV